MREGRDNDDFIIEEEEFSGEEEVVRVRAVHSEKYYDVWIVKFDEMPTMTYAVVNRDTGCIEATQPILHNARMMAKQFSSWLDEDTETKSGTVIDSLRLTPGDKETH